MLTYKPAHIMRKKIRNRFAEPLLPLLKRGAISASATNRPNIGNCCSDYPRFKTYFGVRTKVTEQSFIIKLGILSRPTDLGGRRCSTAVQTSETRTEEEDEKSQGRTYECEWGSL